MPVNVRRHLVGDIYLPKGTPLAHRLRFNRLLRKTAAAARDCKQVWIVNSGYRSYAEQAELYDQYLHHGGTLAAKPGTSNHEGGRALDVSVRTKHGKVPVDPGRRACDDGEWASGHERISLREGPSRSSLQGRYRVGIERRSRSCASAPSWSTRSAPSRCSALHSARRRHSRRRDNTCRSRVTGLRP